MGHNAKILLVEDNLFMQQTAITALERAGFDVDLAPTGTEAMLFCSMNNYEIIFLDCDLPDISGYEVSRELRMRERGTKKQRLIIALTANAMEGDRDRCLNAGMDDYIKKPLTENDILRIKARWMSDVIKLTDSVVPLHKPQPLQNLQG